MRDRGLLRRLVGLAPVEAKLPTLKRKIDIAKQLGKKTKSLEKQLSKAEDKLKKKRAIVDKIAASPLRPMGAFVTFEWERARHVALDLWRPRSFLEFWYTQPSFAQFPVDGPPKDAANAGGGGRGRTSTAASRSDPSVADSEDGRQSSPVAARSSASTSVASEAEAAGAEESRPRAATTVASTGSGRRQPIKAYAAPRPQDVRYENLASRFAISTKARRCCADLVLLLIIILGMVVCLAAVTAKNSADYFAGELLRITNLTTTAQEYSSGVSAILPLPTPDGLLNGTSMMAPTVSSIESCPDEYNQLIRTELLNDPIGYIIRLTRNQEDSVETEAERIQLLVALLSCSLVPTMKILNTFIIVILNLAISLVIRKLVAFSRFDSLTMLHRSIVIRLAVAQFINTALVSSL